MHHQIIKAMIRKQLKNNYRGWKHLNKREKKRIAKKVLDHDFPSDSEGVAIPYGIYDLSRNKGFVCVDTTHDTSEFAVDSIRTTITTAGLKICALLTNKQYKKELKISDQQMKHIALKRYTLRPNWNSIAP